MLSRTLKFFAPAVMLATVSLVACANSTKEGTGTFGSGSGSGSGLGGGGGSTTGGLFAGSGTGLGLGAVDASSDGRVPRMPRLDDAGRTTCLNIASIGRPGATGFQAGMGGGDSTSAFSDWLNAQSSAQVDLYVQKPTINADFLSKYDVLIVQWLVSGVNATTYGGIGYWSFGSDELAALKTWVNNGGGIIFLSGYDSSVQEVATLNTVVGAVSDMSYGTDDVLAKVSTANYCLGESDPLGGWDNTTPLGRSINEVGAFHGRPINPGMGTVDCRDASYVYAAHEDVGMGHVYAYADEWVTYTSQWEGIDAGNSCPADASASTVYQTAQFWYNAIGYAGSATQCVFTIRDSSIVPR